jgi:acyl-CoA synthetase (AMP-forming)/AMP-acid ligase II
MKSPQFSTLIDMLAYRAKVSADKQAFTFNGIPCSYEELWRGINRFAGSLHIERGETVLVALPNSAEFFSAFYGIQRAGGIAVPVTPQSGTERLVQLAKLCDAKLIVAPQKFPIEEQGVSVITVEENVGGGESTFPEIEAGDVAFIQYTSGSTGNPKGVMLTHASLLINIQQMIMGMEITPREVFVSWLPVYHDMGLILKTMVPFYLGAETHLLPTDLRDVRTWMKTLQSRQATFTAAPDFAYRLALSRIRAGEFDLSSLRVALNAAEPVRAATIREFESRFGLRNVMTAGYGLAEATVGVSMTTPGKSPHVDERGIVCVGKPFPDVEVKIVEYGNTMPIGQAEEIMIKSTANCKGYYNNPEETQRLFHNGFIASGDIGYLDAEGGLYILGRKKNIIKHLGQTIAAQELEEIVDAVSGVRFSAAVGIDRGRLEGEQVNLFAEMRGSLSESDFEDRTIQIVETIHSRIGIRPARVIFIKPRGIPCTHNGKIQHTALREKYLSGELKDLVLYPRY